MRSVSVFLYFQSTWQRLLSVPHLLTKEPLRLVRLCADRVRNFVVCFGVFYCIRHLRAAVPDVVSFRGIFSDRARDALLKGACGRVERLVPHGSCLMRGAQLAAFLARRGQRERGPETRRGRHSWLRIS